MITKKRQLFYFVGDKPFPTLLDAQKHDLRIIVDNAFPLLGGVDPKDYNALNDEVVCMLINNSTSITDILTTTPTSRAKARKTNGGSKKSPKRPKLQPAEIPKE